MRFIKKWHWICLLAVLIAGCKKANPNTNTPNSTLSNSVRRSSFVQIPFQRIPRQNPQTPRIPSLADGRYSVPIEYSWEWLTRSSRVSPVNCPAAPVLYRGIQNNFAPITRVVRNMLGDITSELPSWRMSTYLSEYLTADEILQLNEDEWKQARENLLEEFHDSTRDHPSVCAFTMQSVWQTWEGPRNASENQAVGQLPLGNYGGMGEYWNSYGIASSINMSGAASYVNRNDTRQTPGSTLIEITENNPRAAVSFYSENNQNESEYYFPIVIPSVDISAAWFGGRSDTPHLHFLKKVTSSDRRTLISVQVYKIEKPHHSILEFTEGLGNSKILEGEIIPCDPSISCESDPTHNDTELTEVIELISNQMFNGFNFRFQASH